MQIALPNVGRPQSVKGLNKIKRLTLSPSNTEFLLPDLTAIWDVNIFPDCGFELKYWQFLDLKFASLRAETTLLSLLVLGSSGLGWN